MKLKTKIKQEFPARMPLYRGFNSYLMQVADNIEARKASDEEIFSELWAIISFAHSTPSSTSEIEAGVCNWFAEELEMFIDNL